MDECCWNEKAPTKVSAFDWQPSLTEALWCRTEAVADGIDIPSDG
jgi:hypothetical protein